MSVRVTRLSPTLLTLVCALPVTAADAVDADGLSPASEDAVVISASRLPQERAEPHVPVTVIDEDQRRREGRPWQTVNLLAEQPGVILSRSGGISGNAALRINGATTAGTQVRYAGVPLNDPTATQSGPDLTLLNSAAIADIELLTGPQSGLYGSRAVGGVVDLRPLRPSVEHRGRARVQGGSFATIDGLVQASGPLGGRGGYAVGVTGTSSEGISARTTDPDGDPEDFEEDGLDLLGVYARGEVAVVDGLTAFASINHLDAEAEFDSFGAPDSEDPINETTTTVVHGGAFYADDPEQPRLRAAADVAYTRMQRDVPNATFGSREFDGAEWYAAARARWRSGDGPLLAAGLDYRREEAEIVAVSGATSVDDAARHVGLWTRAGWSLDTWQATATLRYESHSEEGDATTGQVQAVAEVVEDRFEVFVNIGNAFRAPSLFELFSSFGNAELEAERSWGAELGHRSRLAPAFRFEQKLFTTRYRERIVFDSTTFTFANSDDDVHVTGVAQSLLFGDLAEHAFQMRFGHVWQEVSDDDSAVALRLPENELHVDLTVAPRADLEATLSIEAVGDRSDFGGATLSSYALIDLAVAWQAHERVEVFARGENLTNESYELADGFAQPGIAGFIGAVARW